MQVNNQKPLSLISRMMPLEYGKVPKGDIAKVGPNTYQTNRYKIEVKNGQVEVFDLKTKTSIKAWGDPHLHTSDGDKMQFHKGNVTIDLEDGTKLTLRPTKPNAQGISLVDAVQIMTPKGGGAQVENISGPGGPKGRMLADSARMDRSWADGTVLEARGEIDDLFFKAGGKEIVGKDPSQRWGEHLLDGKGGRSDIRFDRPIPQFDIRDILSKLGRGQLRRMSPNQLKQVMSRIDQLLRQLMGQGAGGAGGAGGANGAGGSNGAGGANGAGGSSGAGGANGLTDIMSLLKRLLSQRQNTSSEFGNAVRGSSGFAGQMQGVIGGLSGQIDDLKKKLQDPNLSSADRSMIQMELQEKMQERMQLTQMLTNLSKTEHEEKMAVIRNLRVSG